MRQLWLNNMPNINTHNTASHIFAQYNIFVILIYACCIIIIISVVIIFITSIIRNNNNYFVIKYPRTIGIYAKSNISRLIIYFFGFIALVAFLTMLDGVINLVFYNPIPADYGVICDTIIESASNNTTIHPVIIKDCLVLELVFNPIKN